MSEHSPFDAAPDAELGAALREALAMPFGAAFVGRVRARLNGRTRSWDEELAGWFWQGLIAASLITVLAGWGLRNIDLPEEGDSVASRSVATDLLEGATPGTNAILASYSTSVNP